MTAAELSRTAFEANFNPYALAYALATGAKTPMEAFARDGNTAGFFTWNTARWAETRERCVGRFATSQDHLETLVNQLDALKRTA